jgi:hypothetical protein
MKGKTMAEHIQVGDVSPRIQYAGDGIQTNFTYPFPIFSDGDLEVYVDSTVVILDTGYTVSGAGNSAGGEVTFTTAPAAASIVTLRRTIAIERTSDFQQSGVLRAKVLNDELDRLTAEVQQVAEQTNRSLHLKAFDVETSMELPDKSSRADKVLAFDENGVAVASTETLSFMENGATTAATAAVAASISEGNAAVSEDNARSSELAAAASQQTALAATVGKYDARISISSVDSPYTVATLTNDTLITVDTTGGNIVVNLPASATETDNRLLGINKSGATNTITINPNGADTIGGNASFVMYDDTEWSDLYLDKTNTDWQLGNLSYTAAGTGLKKTGSTISLEGGVDIDTDGNLSGHGTEFITQTGTTYTLTASDNGKVVELNNASAVTVTLPQTSTESIPAGFQCTLVQIGAGQVTVAAEGSDTIKSKDSLLSLAGQYSPAYVTKRTAGSPNDWFLAGDLV